MRQIIITERDREAFIEKVRGFPLGKLRFVAEFKVYRRQRSLKQNRLYRLYLECIKEETGNDVDTLHTYFKKKFLPWIVKSVFDQEVSLVPSTSSLNTKQFTEYLEHIKMDMLEQGIFLPNPEDHQWNQFYEKYGLN